MTLYLRHIRRAVALLLVAFMLLASARSLVPNLCATQRALDAGKAEACASQSSCCAPKPLPPGNGPRIKGPQADHPDCALCHLAASLTQHTDSVALEPTQDEATPAPIRAASTVLAWNLDDTCLGRAPPA